MAKTAAETSNIGPREQSKRRLMGNAALLCAAALGFFLFESDAPRWSRMFVFFPLWGAGLGLLQAKNRV